MPSLTVLNILRTIKERGSASRSDLQQLTGLSWGTITNTTRNLLNRNLVREEAATGTRTGRKAVRLTINPGNHSLIGIAIGRRSVRCLALNLAGEVLWSEEFGFEPAESPTTVLEQAADLVRTALALPVLSERICLGVGVAAPGAVDVRNGIMKFASQMPAWRNVPVRQILQNLLSPRVYLEHDPNCLAMAERWFGEAGQAEDVLCINLGEGVGMGILIAGGVVRGSQQFAGEFGHTTVDPNGPACGCGDNGCVEAYASVKAVMEHAACLHDLQSPELAQIFAARLPTVEELVAAARKGDQAAIRTFERMGHYVGIGLANLVDLFNPDVIVLAGVLTAGRDFFMPALEMQVDKRAWKHSNRQLLISRIGEQAKVMGACGMVLESVFEQDLLAGAEAVTV